MSGGSASVKPVGELGEADFREHPIWGWYDEGGDSDLAEPLSETELAAEGESEHNTLFVFSEFVLNDGTKMNGSVSAVRSARWVYLLTLFDERGLHDFSLNPGLKQEEPHRPEDLARQLGKPIDRIFPLRYATRYSFPDGTPIAGEITLEEAKHGTAGRG